MTDLMHFVLPSILIDLQVLTTKRAITNDHCNHAFFQFSHTNFNSSVLVNFLIAVRQCALYF